MKYNFIPNTVKIKDNMNEEKFLELQIKYKQSFEQFLNRIIKFEDFDYPFMEMSDPEIDDKDYNFYHKYSKLKSKYIFLRNNIHIENLSNDEINVIENNNIDDKFLLKTMTRVLYENADISHFGAPCDLTSAKSKSLVFEVAYNLSAFLTMNQIIDTEKKGKETLNKIEEQFSKYGIPVSGILCNGMDSIYLKNNENIKKQ